MRKVWLNKKLVPESRAVVSVFDRGFLYGDGVYEAVRIYQGKIFRAEAHWRRLAGSLQGIHLTVPWSPARLTAICAHTARANGLNEALVRVTISRGPGELGYDPSSCVRPTLTAIAAPIRPDLSQLWRRGVKVALVQVRRNPLRSLSPAIKHTNSLNGILAKMESLKQGAFEGVFLNLEGNLAEGTISNLFLARGGTLFTPTLDSGILEGVTRGTVLEIARRAGIPVQEARLKPQALLGADEAFLTSTTMEVMPIIRVGTRRIGTGTPGALTRSLHRLFRATVERELKISLEPF